MGDEPPLHFALRTPWVIGDIIKSVIRNGCDIACSFDYSPKRWAGTKYQYSTIERAGIFIIVIDGNAAGNRGQPGGARCIDAHVLCRCCERQHEYSNEKKYMRLHENSLCGAKLGGRRTGQKGQLPGGEVWLSGGRETRNVLHEPSFHRYPHDLCGVPGTEL